MSTPNDEKQSQTHKIAKILNYIGGTLIFFGVCYLIFNNWNILATLSRILLTLGLACWSLLLGVSLQKNENNLAASAVFFTLGALLLPLGLSVTLNSLNLYLSYDIKNIFITCICSLVFLILYWRYPREILLLFCVLFPSLFFIAITNFINNGFLVFPNGDLLDYQVLVLGISYLLLGYGASFRNSALTGPLYFFGDLMILGASFNLAGLLLADKIIFVWVVISSLLLFANFILAIQLHSKALLYLSAIFLIIYITNLTRQFAYLFGNLGWPIILIGAGVLLMLLGYILVRLQRKTSK